MDPKEIRELIELVSRSNLQSLELDREGWRLKLVKGEQSHAAAAPVVAPPPMEHTAPSGGTVAVTPAPSAVAPPDGLVALRAPIVGTFYRAASPDAPPFAEVGNRVKKGQTICIVEAMKVMNEIESEIDAEVVEVAVANGQPVEYGEVLFRLRPLS